MGSGKKLFFYRYFLELLHFHKKRIILENIYNQVLKVIIK